MVYIYEASGRDFDTLNVDSNSGQVVDNFGRKDEW